VLRSAIADKQERDHRDRDPRSPTGRLNEGTRSCGSRPPTSTRGNPNRHLVSAEVIVSPELFALNTPAGFVWAIASVFFRACCGSGKECGVTFGVRVASGATYGPDAARCTRDVDVSHSAAGRCRVPSDDRFLRPAGCLHPAVSRRSKLACAKQTGVRPGHGKEVGSRDDRPEKV